MAIQPAFPDSNRLEQWPSPMYVGDMRDVDESNRKVNREIDSLRRERDSIQRLIDQAKLQDVSDSLKVIRDRMDAIEKILES